MMAPGVCRYVVAAWVGRNLDADGRPVDLVAEAARMDTERLEAIMSKQADVTLVELSNLCAALDADPSGLVATIVGVGA